MSFKIRAIFSLGSRTQKTNRIPRTKNPKMGHPILGSFQMGCGCWVDYRMRDMQSSDSGVGYVIPVDLVEDPTLMRVMQSSDLGVWYIIAMDLVDLDCE